MDLHSLDGISLGFGSSAMESMSLEQRFTYLCWVEFSDASAGRLKAGRVDRRRQNAATGNL